MNYRVVVVLKELDETGHDTAVKDLLDRRSVLLRGARIERGIVEEKMAVVPLDSRILNFFTESMTVAGFWSNKPAL